MFGSLNHFFEYSNKLNETNNFYLKLGAMENFEDFSNDYRFTAVTGLIFAVAENMSVSIEEELRYDALPRYDRYKKYRKDRIRLLSLFRFPNYSLGRRIKRIASK